MDLLAGLSVVLLTAGGAIGSSRIQAPPQEEPDLPIGRVAELFDTLERLGQPASFPPPAWPAWEDDSPAGWGGEAV